MGKGLKKDEIIAIFYSIATLLELLGDNPFKIRAYRAACAQMENIESGFGKMVKENKLVDLPGIGKDLASKITILYNTGKLPLYDELKKRVPESLLEMLKIPGLGAKKIKAIHDALGIESIKELKKACLADRIANLQGFGKKTEQIILNGIENLEKYSKKHLWWEGNEIAEWILKYLKKQKGVEKTAIAGSLRRCKETIGDIDLLAASKFPKKTMDWFCSMKSVTRVIGKRLTKSSIRLNNGMQVDLRVVTEKEFPFALHHFTGSKEHNVKLRKRAKSFGLTLNEYGLFSIGSKKSKTITSEKELFKALKLGFIPAELREDRGEIEAAEKETLPKLIEEKDIRGLFHTHTTASDGHNTLNQMIKAAEKMDFEYIGISDHSRSSFYASGLSIERLLQQVEEIKKINRSKKYKIHIFSGVECDILYEGELDYPDDVLKQLDFCIVAIHSRLKHDEKIITKRLIKAIENPYMTMLAHMTGRLLLRREPYPLNTQKVIDACIANKKIIEINANPSRLDIDWRLLHAAKEKGLLTCINPDAHSVDGLIFYKAGVNVARKGWLEKEDVFNTFPLNKVKKYLAN